MLDNTTNQLSKFQTKNVLKKNVYKCEEYGTSSGQIKFKTTILKSSSCDYSNAYKCAKGIVTIVEDEEDADGTAGKKSSSSCCRQKH